MKKRIRKSIRIDGKPVSKSFTNAEAAKAWYSQMHSKKVLGDMGLAAPASKGGILFKEFALGEFMERRKKNYPKSTWGADEQRLRDHVLPALGHLKFAKVRTSQIRSLLQSLVEKKGLSKNTRDRVQALISVIYSEAINRDDGPLVDTNPTYGIAFRRGKRTGQKAPSFLQTKNECIKYFKAARELSLLHLGVAALGIMGGLRKQEMIPLKVSAADFESHALEIREKFIQAEGRIVKGTKGGEEVIRYVPMAGALEKIVAELCDGAGQGDFVLRKADGSHLSPREIYSLGIETAARAGVKVTVHGLRHTFGREFAERSGNMGALKDIMGHSNLATTQRYSELGKERLKRFKDVMDFDI